MQMESSNYPPMHIELGILAVFSCSLFHRLLSLTFVGRVISLNNFRTSSTELIKCSMRSVMLSVGADIYKTLFGSALYIYFVKV